MVQKVDVGAIIGSGRLDPSRWSRRHNRVSGSLPHLGFTFGRVFRVATVSELSLQ